MEYKYVEETAPAKINLALAITGELEAGYHLLQTVFQSVSLNDELRLERKGKELTCLCGSLSGEQNIAWQAASHFLEKLSEKTGERVDFGVEIRIEKKIPIQAGLAGGSSDAAAVLRGLNRMWGFPFEERELLDLAARCGSDVPFCLRGGTQWGEGRGTALTEMPAAAAATFLIVKPREGVDTASAYRLFDARGDRASLDKEAWRCLLLKKDIASLANNLVNNLEPVVTTMVPEVKRMKERLLRGGCLGALLSGSGSAVFGILPDEQRGTAFRNELLEDGYTVFVAKNAERKLLE